MQLRSVVIVGALVFCVLAACEQLSGSAPPDIQSVAGKVVEVAGRVTVEAAPDRRARAMALVVGDEIAGADVIVTGPHGRVAIKLHHNGAVWNLGPNKRGQLSQSAAWTAPKSDGKSLVFGKAERDRTAAAGRHSEREVASTRGTASNKAQKLELNAGEAETTEAAATQLTPRATSRVAPTAQPVAASSDKSLPKPKGKVVSKTRPMLQLARTALHAKGKRRVTASRRAVRRAIESRFDAMVACVGKRTIRKTRLRLVLRVGRDGVVARVNAKARNASLVACANEVYRGLKLDVQSGRGPFTVDQRLLWKGGKQ